MTDSLNFDDYHVHVYGPDKPDGTALLPEDSDDDMFLQLHAEGHLNCVTLPSESPFRGEIRVKLSDLITHATAHKLSERTNTQ